jgi:hypothetical protein
MVSNRKPSANPSRSMPKIPPGHALNIHQASQTLKIFSSRSLWLVVLLPPLWGILCGGSALISSETLTTPLRERTLSQRLTRRLGRLAGAAMAITSLLLVLAVMLQTSWSMALAPVIITAIIWTLYFPVLGHFLSQIARSGSALHRRVRRLTARATLASAGLLFLTALLPDILWALDQTLGPAWLSVLGLAWLLFAGVSVTLPRSYHRLFADFWGVVTWSGTLSVGTIQEILADRTRLVVLEEPIGLSAEGERRGLRVSVSLDLAHAPGELRITVISPRLAARHPDLTLRRRGAGEEPGVRLADPVLSGTLLVRAEDDRRAAALLDTLHEDLLSVFHPYENAHLSAGRLTLRITGPPFADAERSVDVGMFVVDRVEECIGLMAALEERAAQTPAMVQRSGMLERR